MCTAVPLPHILFSLWFQLKKHQTNHFESQNLDNMNQSLLNKNIFTQCIFKTKMLFNTKKYHHNFRNWADGKYIHGDANHDRLPWNKEKISWKFLRNIEDCGQLEESMVGIFFRIIDQALCQSKLKGRLSSVTLTPPGQVSKTECSEVVIYSCT